MKDVLLVEDHPGIALALGVRLKSMGYGVTTAPDAVTAVSHARRRRPDVLVLDIGLPGGDGYLVSERIARLRDNPGVPVIFITASREPGLKDRALQRGAVAFLQKPFDAGMLADAIEVALTPQRGAQPPAAASGAALDG